MGRFWLHDLDDILRPGVGNGIVRLETLHGWEMRSRSSGGLDVVGGLLDHHTASPESWNWDKDIEYIGLTNPYAPSPISQLYLDRRGWLCIIAAGAANHGGRGGAYKPGGPTMVTVNGANTQLIGKEMGNDGRGEQWPWEQIFASIDIDARICLAEKWGPGHVFGHKEYCGPGTTTPGRKIDPFGPWENHPQGYWRAGSSWGGGQDNIDYYRSLVAKRMVELSQEVGAVHGFVPRPSTIAPRILDSRGGNDRYKLNSRTTATVTVPGGAGKSHAIVNFTIVQPEAGGHVIAWDSGPVPTASIINYAPGQVIANEVTVPLAADGTFRIQSHARTHVVIDLVGYYQKL